jgi:hypothetical protein
LSVLFPNLPELEWAFGYPLVLVVMALICLVVPGVPAQRLAVASRRPA